MLQGRKVLTMNVRAEESNLNSNVDRWEGRIAGRTITHFLTLKTMQGGGNTQNRSFRKIIILIHPSWLMLFMLFWALQAEKFYLSQRLTRSMDVNIAVQGNLWQFFNSAMHLQIFELCCPAFGIFVYAPSGKWPLKTIMGVLLKDVAFEKSSSEMHCKVYLL